MHRQLAEAVDVGLQGGVRGLLGAREGVAGAEARGQRARAAPGGVAVAVADERLARAAERGGDRRRARRRRRSSSAPAARPGGCAPARGTPTRRRSPEIRSVAPAVRAERPHRRRPGARSKSVGEVPLGERAAAASRRAAAASSDAATSRRRRGRAASCRRRRAARRRRSASRPRRRRARRARPRRSASIRPPTTVRSAAFVTSKTRVVARVAGCGRRRTRLRRAPRRGRASPRSPPPARAGGQVAQQLAAERPHHETAGGLDGRLVLARPRRPRPSAAARPGRPCPRSRCCG